MVRICFFFILISISALHSFAQEIPKLAPEERRLVYDKEWSFMPSLSSRGWGIGGRYSKTTSNFVKYSFEAEIVKIKHPKEFKQANPYFEDAKSYAYGKKNSFYSFRLGLGRQFLLFDKAPQDGVEISFSLMGGLSGGLLKPVYLEILKETSLQNYYETTSEKYDENKHFPINIYGYSGFSKGFNEIKFVPGGYIRSGFNFDWGKKDNKISAIELGTIVDIFPSKILIMADLPGVENNQVFISFYANLLLGKKY